MELGKSNLQQPTTSSGLSRLSASLRDGNATEEEIEKLFQLLEEGERILANQSQPTEATLILGNTGSGKSTFTLWIADYDGLTAEKDPYTPGEYLIKDPYGKIGSDPTKSETVFPDLLFNNQTGAAYYDFAGFIDTRGVAYDIAIAYFIKKVVDSVEKVKMNFMVNYGSVTGQGTRDDFVKMVTHATQFVKQPQKYKDTTLTVSKVPALLNFLPDQDILEPIANFITKTKESFAGNANALQFIDGLLQKNGDTFTHIQFSLRGVNQTGLLSNMPHMVEKKRTIQAAMNKFDFVQTSEDDFGYGVAKQSLSDARTLIERMNERTSASLARFAEETHKHVYNEEVKLYDMVALYNQAASTHNKLAETKKKANSYAEPEKCVREIGDRLAFVNSPIAKESLSNATKNADYSSFVRTVSGVDVSFKCADALDDVVGYADKSENWYRFLIELYNDKLSTYEVQRNTSSSACNGLAKFVLEGEAKENQSSGILEKYVKDCSPQYNFKPVSNIIMDKPKFGALRSLLDSTMNHRLDAKCESDNTLTIRGQYVKFGDVREKKNTCNTPLKSVKIFALDRVFVNEDLEIEGEVLLSVIAPTWEVLGTQKVVLRGDSGKSHDSPKASSGQSAGEAGKAGKPGLSGGPSGSFFGIGDKFYNVADFFLSLIGGSGGPGQHGGDGKYGTSGANAYNDLIMEVRCPKVSASHTIREYECIGTQCLYPGGTYPCTYEDRYTLAGKNGIAGGNGGNGGKNGKGGRPGDYIFVSTSSNGINVRAERKEGQDGANGDGGAGANGGQNGRDMRITIRTQKKKVLSEQLLDSSFAPHGKNGVAGANAEGSETPKPPGKLPNTSNIVNEYKAYVRENLFHSVRESELRDFLGKLESSTFSAQIQSRRRRSADVDLDRKSAIGSTFGFGNRLSSSSSSHSKYENSVATPGRTDESHSLTLERVDANGSLAFADFLIRCVTKVKPYDSTENATNFSEIKASTLNIVTQFEKILTRVAVDLDLLENQSFEFDPIALMSELDKVLNNRDYQKISKILYQAIENKNGLDYVFFENYMQPQINQMLAGKQEGNLYNTCVVSNGNHPMNNVRIGIGAHRSDFNRLGYKIQENNKLE